jgi:hypothetical protein
MPLNGALQAILCRSPAERAMLLHLLGPHREEWSSRIRVHRTAGLFESRFTYLDTFDASTSGVRFALHPRRDGASVECEIIVRDPHGRTVLSSTPALLNPAMNWIVKGSLPPNEYLAIVRLEGCLAYEAAFLTEELPF